LLVSAYLRGSEALSRPSQQPPQAEVSALSQPGIFSDSENHFRICHPDGWTLIPHPHSKDLVKLDINCEAKRSGLQVRVYSKRIHSLSSFADWYEQDFGKQMTGSKLLAREICTLGKNSVITLSFDGRARNGYFLKTYLIDGDHCFYAMQSGCPFKAKTEIEPLLDNLAASFEMLRH